MIIVYPLPSGDGWTPITHMVRLAAEFLEADLRILPSPPTPGLVAKLGALLPRRRGTESCLVVCPGPQDLRALMLVENWRTRFRRTVAWVIDSYWIEWIPRVFSHSRAFDQIFVTTDEDVTEWAGRMRTPTAWLPWGADVLGLGGYPLERPIDLLRVGRQPTEWDDDSSTAGACREAGLVFHGRPGGNDDATENQRHLYRLYGQSKYLLAFSNTVNPTVYTHPQRDYLTGRWTDALACGAVVAGVSPRGPSARQLLWPEATLELGTVRRADGLRILTEAVHSWTPERARVNCARALERLDWRWRFATLAKALGESPERLREELRRLAQAVAANTCAPP